MSKLIDTHCHPYFEHFDQDRLDMLERTFEVCESVICVGAGVPESRASLALAQSDHRIFASVGVHPHDINRDKVEDLREFTAHPKLVAIGECGLDYKTDPVHDNRPVDKEKQIEAFTHQVKLANELGLPVIIHARDCWEDLISIMKDLRPNAGVIHSWTGGLKEADEIINLGLYLSFSGMITYPANEHIREVARMAPEDRILVETDSPFLPPQEIRGQRNEPGRVMLVAEKLAEVRGVTPDQIAEITTANARKLFRLPPK